MPKDQHLDSNLSSEGITPAYLRLKGAAAYTGLSEQMLLKLHRMGDGPPRIKKGRAVLYSIKALEEWMDKDVA
jgi:predicted DNA-binding transcriptional regulator AlpA